MVEEGGTPPPGPEPAGNADADGGDEEFDAFVDFLNGPPAEAEAEKPFDPKESDVTQRTRPESVADSDDDDASLGEAVVFTDEELDAARAVRARLSEVHGIERSRVGSTFLTVATINCKLRVDETATKVSKLLEIMSSLGCPDGIDDELWKPEAARELKPYAPSGRDRRGCRSTWIRGGGKVQREDERAHVHACIMQFLATHADPKTLREGLSFVIDLSAGEASAKRPKVGNERLIQSFYQSIPQRPQAIVLAGASLFMRTFVMATIKLASVFIKQKILQRIHFVTVEQAKAMLPAKSVPVYVGGGGGGIENYEEWVRERLGRLPRPEL